MEKIWIILVACLVLTQAANAQSIGQGAIEGSVVDAQSREALVGVNIMVQGTTRGTTTDINGHFRINGLEAGIYNVSFRYLGYQTYVQTDVVVRNHRPAVLAVTLSQIALEGEEVVVRASFFAKNDAAPVSRIGFNAEEIRRSPGAGQELSRVIMASPGVATSGDISQDLLVRGGSPSENGFYIDHIPVPGVNHFERQNGSTSGPIGIINTDLVEQLDFYSGGFSATFGNHASSVADIRYREGSRKQFHGNVLLGMAGAGFSIETPVFQRKGSVLLSMRRSYLDLLANAINAGGAPSYSDVQFKGVYDINNENKLTLLNIYGESLFENTLQQAIDEGFDSAARSFNNQNTTGLNWRRLWNANAYSNTSVSWSFKQDQTVITDVETLEKNMEFDIFRTFATFRNTNYVSLDDKNRVEFGFQTEYRTADFDYFFGPGTNMAGVAQPAYTISLDMNEWQSSTFATWMIRPTTRLSFSVGARLDYTSINEELIVSPRATASWMLTERLALNLAAGSFAQSLPLYYRSQNPSFESLKNYKNTQIIAGLAYQLSDNTMISAEVYDKQYRNLPALPTGHSKGFEFAVLETESFFEELTDNGKAYARGVDLLLQKKMAKNLYGMVSASFFSTEFKDSQGNWNNSSFDVSRIFNIIGGYRPGNNWEFSARWTYYGERPYTPIDPQASMAMNMGILDLSQYNQGRIPAYHSLFVRFDKRWFYDKIAITTFMEVWNTYNRRNIGGYYWNNTEQTIESWTQFSTLPAGGFSIEF